MVGLFFLCAMLRSGRQLPLRGLRNYNMSTITLSGGVEGTRNITK